MTLLQLLHWKSLVNFITKNVNLNLNNVIKTLIQYILMLFNECIRWQSLLSLLHFSYIMKHETKLNMCNTQKNFNIISRENIFPWQIISHFSHFFISNVTYLNLFCGFTKKNTTPTSDYNSHSSQYIHKEKRAKWERKSNPFDHQNQHLTNWWCWSHHILRHSLIKKYAMMCDDGLLSALSGDFQLNWRLFSRWTEISFGDDEWWWWYLHAHLLLIFFSFIFCWFLVYIVLFAKRHHKKKAKWKRVRRV